MYISFSSIQTIKIGLKLVLSTYWTCSLNYDCWTSQNELLLFSSKYWLNFKYCSFFSDEILLDGFWYSNKTKKNNNQNRNGMHKRKSNFACFICFRTIFWKSNNLITIDFFFFLERLACFSRLDYPLLNNLKW